MVRVSRDVHESSHLFTCILIFILKKKSIGLRGRIFFGFFFKAICFQTLEHLFFHFLRNLFMKLWNFLSNKIFDFFLFRKSHRFESLQNILKC